MNPKDRVDCLPFARLRFDKHSRIVDARDVEHLQDRIANGVTDLIVVSHGWNTNMDEAEGLYDRFFGEVCKLLPQHVHERLAVVGVLWPSKRFTDPDQIPGGAASVRRGLSPSEIERAAEQVSDVLEPADLEEMKAFLARVGDPQAQHDLVALLQRYLRSLEMPADEAPTELMTRDGEEIFNEFEKPFSHRSGLRPSRDAGSSGGAAGLFPGVGGAALNLLNVFTYYTMRDRAGKIGCDGLNPVLHDLKEADASLRLHLVGHSFGARLVTATVSGCGNALAIDSLTLLQAAFSHYAFAQNFDGRGSDGLFRHVVEDDLVAGPVLVTHTRNDRAVGIAYALASRLARQVAAAIGDRSDRFGGLGRNGAHPDKTPEAVDLEIAEFGGRSVESGTIYNLLADGVIKNHSDIVHPETAGLVVRAVLS